MLKIHAFCVECILILFAVFGAGCAAAQMELTYHNPVWEGYLADPQVLCVDGVYYAYGTGPADENGRQFPVLRSDDFVTWTYLGGALESVADPAIRDYWAPEVAHHNGRFYLYYAGDQKMRVAVSDHPEGPFKDTGRLLFPDEPFSIDGHPFFDPVSAQWYLFFAKDFFDQRVGTALAVVRLGEDMISTVGPVTTVLRAFSDWQIYERNRTLYDQLWEAWHTVEGPFVVYRDGRYYCFYSGGNWQTPGYGVGCAVAENVTGPYRDRWSIEKASVISTIPGQLIGPGHNSVILAPDNQTYFMAYHSWNTERTKRQMCIDPIVWTEQGPKVLNPSRGVKTVRLPLSSSATGRSADDAKDVAPALFGTFVNPVYEGADPFVYKHTDGYYYFCQSEGDKGISIWKSDRLTDKGIKRIVWLSPETGWNSSNVWAPEIHYLNDKWYIYYAADDGDNANHRTGVLESVTQDAQGDYIDRGIVYTGDHIETGRGNRWAIDATPLQMNGRLYLIWSGWLGQDDDIQSLYIAEMENPWTTKTNRVKIADNDTYVWERVSENPTLKGLNEGPQILKNDGRIYVIYSCSNSWGPTYKLGQLSIQEGDDPMNPANWTKKSTPVFQGSQTVHGVGHAMFTTSADDTEHWIVYHSKISPQSGWQRNVRIQPFTFRADGSPDFGTPYDAGRVLKRPSGEPLPKRASRFGDDFEGNHWDNWCYYGFNRFIDVQNGRLMLGYNPGWGIANHYRSGEKAIVRDRVWDDVVLQTRVRIVEGHRDAGVIFRVHHPSVGYDAMKGYFAGIIPGTQKAVLGKMDGTNWTELALVDFPCQVNRWYRLKVVAEKDKIRVFVDDRPVIEKEDDTYAIGYAGVRVVDVYAEFDDIEVSAVSIR